MRQCGPKNSNALTSVPGARFPATTAFFSMADSVVTRQSRSPRGASTKRRQATVSTETENRLARAARPARRFAPLGDAAHDDCTLDLFPDDPTRATLELMNIDIRQRTLHGFELPGVVLAAVGAIDGAVGRSLAAKAARRTPRAARIEEPVQVNAQLSGLEIVDAPESESSSVAVSREADIAEEVSKQDDTSDEARSGEPPCVHAATPDRHGKASAVRTLSQCHSPALHFQCCGETRPDTPAHCLRGANMSAKDHKFSIEELLCALLRDRGIHEGHWALNVEFSATGASVKPADDAARTLPGLIVSMNAATLVPADSSAAGAVDAAIVNPRKRTPAAKSSRNRKPVSTTLQ